MILAGNTDNNIRVRDSGVDEELSLPPEKYSRGVITGINYVLVGVKIIFESKDK